MYHLLHLFECEFGVGSYGRDASEYCVDADFGANWLPGLLRFVANGEFEEGRKRTVGIV